LLVEDGGLYDRGPVGTPLFVLPVAVTLLPLADGITVTAPEALLAFAGVPLAVGFVEETIFRWLILTALIPEGILRAVLASSAMFAALHLLNVLSGAWDPYFTIADIIAAYGLFLLRERSVEGPGNPESRLSVIKNRKIKKERYRPNVNGENLLQPYGRAGCSPRGTAGSRGRSSPAGILEGTSTSQR